MSTPRDSDLDSPSFLEIFGSGGVLETLLSFLSVAKAKARAAERYA